MSLAAGGLVFGFRIAEQIVSFLLFYGDWSQLNELGQDFIGVLNQNVLVLNAREEKDSDEL